MENVCPGAPRKITSHVSRVNRSVLAMAGAYPPPAPVKKKVYKAKRQLTPNELELFHSTRDSIAQVRIDEPVDDLDMMIADLKRLQLTEHIQVDDLIDILEQVRLGMQHEFEERPTKRRRIDTPPNSPPKLEDY